MSQPNHENVTPLTAAKPQTSYVSVTPDLAARWLTANQVNRNLRGGKVEQYARDMTEGRWQLSNDAICFDRDGHLLNGQHRLNAVIKSGQTVVMLIVRNMASSAMTVMDSGSGRTASDALGFDGELNSALLAATTKQAILYSDGRIYGDNKFCVVSHAEIRAFLQANPDLRDSVRCVLPHRRAIDAPPSTIACAHWIINRRLGASMADVYIEQLATRTNESEGSAVLAVDSRLRQIRLQRQSLPPRNYIYLLIKGWNHFARGQRVKSIESSPRNAFRIPEPVRWAR